MKEKISQEVNLFRTVTGTPNVTWLLRQREQSVQYTVGVKYIESMTVADFLRWIRRTIQAMPYGCASVDEVVMEAISLFENVGIFKEDK